MKERKPTKKKTPGDKIVEQSNKNASALIQQAKQSVKQGERHVSTDDRPDKLLPLPKWVIPRLQMAYTEFLHLVCQGKLANFSEFSRKYTVTRETIYQWLAHQDTKNLVDEFIKALATADKALVYQQVLSQVPQNASYARLWMERYEGYQPDQPQHGAVTINFNFLDPPKEPDQSVKQADIEDAEIVEDDNP